LKTLIVLAAVLLAAVAEFLVIGRPALAAERQAHADLLAREASVKAMEARLPPSLSEELGALLADRDHQAQLARKRLQLLSGAPAAVTLASFDELLEARKDRALAMDSRLGTSVRAQRTGSPRAEQALALLLTALGDAKGLEVLELSEAGKVVPVPDIPELEQVQASLVLTCSLTDALAVLERLAPAPAGGLPFAGVLSSSLRRVEPERWGSELHLFDTPPVRLAVTVAICFARDAEGKG